MASSFFNIAKSQWCISLSKFLPPQIHPPYNSQSDLSKTDTISFHIALIKGL
jgi:hypothetical protein